MAAEDVDDAQVRALVGSSAGAADKLAGDEEDIALELYKTFRKLNKKLRQIQALRDKLRSGNPLDEQQELKLSALQDTGEAFDAILVRIFFQTAARVRARVLYFIQCGVNGQSRPPPESMETLAKAAFAAKKRVEESFASIPH